MKNKPMLASLALALLLTSCATQESVGRVRGGAPNTAARIRLELGPVGVISPPTPAEFGFDKAGGRIESAADAAGHAAGLMQETPTFSDPALEMAAGGVRFVLAPVAAAAAALGPGHSKLPPPKLSKSESDLAQAMASVADQPRFQECLLKAAGEKIPGRLVPIDSLERPSPGAPPLSAILETITEELRLERTGSVDDSFALRIKTRVRLLSSEDGALLYEQPFEFRSGTDLFIDWTRCDALRSVADTGYRELAGHIVNQLFSTAPEGPILVGAGYKNHPPRASDSQVLVAAHHYEAGPRPTIQFVTHGYFDSASLAQDRSPTATVPQFVSGRLPVLGGLSIYSTASVAPVTIQRPLTKDQAVSEALDDVEWSLDGLDKSHNSVIMLMASAVAIPMSLWKQTAGAARGLTSEEFRADDERLTAAARQTQPHEQLAYHVAQQLMSKTSQPVVLVKGPLPLGSEGQVGLVQAVARSSPPGLQQNLTITNHPVAQGTETALQIHLLSAALTGEGSVNPPLSLCVEAKATLLRARDGQELYSCSVHYRSGGRKFTAWAANDARLFRQEFDQCYHQVGSAIAAQLLSGGFIAPERGPIPTLARIAK